MVDKQQRLARVLFKSAVDFFLHESFASEDP